jgi:hypothetical protein
MSQPEKIDKPGEAVDVLEPARGTPLELSYSPDQPVWTSPKPAAGSESQLPAKSPELETHQAESLEFFLANIEGAQNLQEVISIIRHAGLVKGKDNINYPATFLIKRIQEFVEFFGKNIDALLVSVINNKKTQALNGVLAEKLDNIPIEGLGLKIKEIMRVEWDKHFQGNKREIMFNAIKTANSIDELCHIVGQYKTIHFKNQFFEPSSVVDSLRRINSKLKLEALANAWEEKNAVNIWKEVKTALAKGITDERGTVLGVPNEAGIYDHACSLVFNEVLQTIRDNPPKAGVFKRLTKGFLRWFS